MQVKSSRILAADVAVEHLAEMKRDAAAHGLASRRVVAPQRRHGVARLARRDKRAPAGGRGVAVAPGQRKDREEPVAHELQHLAALAMDRGYLTIEIAIEESDELWRRQPVGTRGEAAHV